MKRWAVGIVAAVLFSGCSSAFLKSRPSILPEYIHKIAVRPFSNHTQQYGLEDKLTLAVQSEFNRDGRYQITTAEQAEGLAIGDITKYILEARSYDSNHVPTEYKLTILAAVSFTDKVKNATLWTEPNMTGELRYYVASSGFAGSMTEDEARQTIFDQLARDIATRTFEGFGSSGGKTENGTSKPEAEREAPKKPIDNNPPEMPSTEPSAPSPMKQPY